jgi:hypothetical protein
MGHERKSSSLGRERWPRRKEFLSEQKNIVNDSLVDPQKIFLSPHQACTDYFVTAMKKTEKCFRYLIQKNFLRLVK